MKERESRRERKIERWRKEKNEWGGGKPLDNQKSQKGRRKKNGWAEIILTAVKKHFKKKEKMKS